MLFAAQFKVLRRQQWQRIRNHRMSTLVTISGQHVVDAGDFDKVLDQYFGSTDEFRYINSFFGCQSWAGHPKPRYRIAYTCRSLLESAEARACNQDYKPQPLCASACNSYVGEWSALTSDTDMCANTTLAESNRQSLERAASRGPTMAKLESVYRTSRAKLRYVVSQQASLEQTNKTRKKSIGCASIAKPPEKPLLPLVSCG
ncbi:hypothetical protein BX661DRAFT_40039 [Kickxella alabastrina]|uniref:uncharacterized protein n=1 Tax=Kickxella alabastrina TaxID=61397 RepID=UPI0022206171|nr:uncharacterized protein BX661DRAFT_40039 [Kickxella alabastrina]KAI7825576.1 hypothetical protein BX661DRAFT_40039 [Kickxella alabastrina]